MFHNESYAKQLNHFGGIGYQLTDIDGALDFNGKAFVYLEGKCFGGMPEGQKRFLESAVLSHWKAGHPSMLIFYWHGIKEGNIFLSGCTVTSVFSQKLLPGFHWYRETEYQTGPKLTIGETISLFKKHYKI